MDDMSSKHTFFFIRQKEQTNGMTKGWSDIGMMDGSTKGQMDAEMDGRMFEYVQKQINGWMNAKTKMHELMDSLIDAWRADRKLRG